MAKAFGEVAVLVVWYPVILAAIFAGGAALALVFARLHAERLKPQLRQSLQALASGLGAKEKDDRFSTPHEGLSFEIQLSPAEGISACLEVSTNLDNITRDATEAPAGYRGNPSARVLGRPTIHLRKKTWWSRLGARLRIVRDADTGDSAFDEMFCIEASAPDEDIRRVLSEPRARSALLDIAKAGADRITINAKGAALTVAFFARDEVTINVFTFLRATSGIASAAPFLPVFGACAPRTRRLPLVGALWALALVALLTTPLVMTTTLQPGSSRSFWSGISFSGFAVGFAVWMLLLPVLGRLLRRHFGARLHLFGLASALLASLPVHGASALCALVGPASTEPAYIAMDWPRDGLRRTSMAHNYLAMDWTQDAYKWAWTPLAPVPPLDRAPVKRGAFTIQSASVGRLATSSQTFEVYIQLWNEADVPRWFVVPWRADLTGISAGEPIHSLGAHELGGRGRVVVVELLRKDGGGSQAFLVPARASISIERLVITGGFPSLPRLIPIKTSIARELSIGGTPLSAWLPGSPISDKDAVVVDERTNGRARPLSVRVGHADRPIIAFDEEESGRALALQSPENQGD